MYSLRSRIVRTESLEEFSLLELVLPEPLAKVTLLTMLVSETEFVCWRTDTMETPPTGSVLYFGSRAVFRASELNPSNVI